MTNPRRVRRLLAALLPFALVAASPSSVPAPPASEPGAYDLGRPEIQQFVAEVSARHGLAADDVAGLLAAGRFQPRIIEAMTRPAERVSPWFEYRARFVTQRRIDEGVAFLDAHRSRLEAAEQATGVDPCYIVAIIGVETFYGRNTGSWRVLDALMTLGFDYPPRATFFRGELEQFLLLVREERIDPRAALGSYAGAMGAPQFIPSSYRRFAVDGGGDGRRDLFLDWDDVIASVANYFAEHGWQRNGAVLAEADADPALMATLDPRNLELNATAASLRAAGVRFSAPVPDDAPAILLPAELADRPAVRVGFGNFRVITRYNRSIRYAMAVHDLAEAIRERAAEQAAAARVEGIATTVGVP
jgi:membrane-bound lytic murein transglycosylase B